MIINLEIYVYSGEAKECQGNHQERQKRRRKSAGETSTSVICSPLLSVSLLNIFGFVFMTKSSFLMYYKTCTSVIRCPPLSLFVFENICRKGALYMCKTALYMCKRGLYMRKSALRR